MKKIVLCLVAAAALVSARADEGMWLLPYLQKMNIRQMKQRGCKLSADEIYSLDRSSLKDAVVIFGGGCTGEIVSPEGLLFTNHHCGYGSIQQLSSVEHDYLKHGFWAMSNAEELPVPGLKVRFVRKIADATADILGNVPSIAGQEEYEQAVEANSKALTERLREEYPGMEVAVLPFFEGNQYFAFVYEVFTDIRLVGTPPSSIGKFGGDTDNWMWPRHTGDFSIFRVYAGPDNKPADYSPENRPYRAEKYLKVSLGGVEENDFAMIMGFPGSTQRYATSYEIDNMLRVSNPQRIFIRGERQAILWEDMLASDKVRIQYASKYAGSSNYWKNSIGMSRGIEKLNVKARKQAQEAEFQAWAEANTLPQEGYIDALLKIREAFETSEESMAGLQYLSEAFLRGIELLAPAMTFARVSEIKHPEKTKSAMSDWYKDYNAPTDRKVAKRMLRIARENMKTLPSFYTEIIDNEFGGDIDAYVDYLYDNSVFVSEDDVVALIDDFSAEKVAADPAVVLGKSVLDLYAKLGAERQAPAKQLAEGRRKYVAGLMLQQPDNPWAADANFTIRLT
ncbi:MAG: S46 family peptidase, partial [Alistipes sp.]|nr:S46 family peptidase [Alistipes sp.]